MTEFTPEQIKAREQVWLASVANTEVTLSADEAKALVESIKLTGEDLCKLREFAREAAKTPAVKQALLYTAQTGKSSIRKEDGTPSVPASVVGYGLGRGAEAVQQEIDRFVDLTY